MSKAATKEENSSLNNNGVMRQNNIKIILLRDLLFIDPDSKNPLEEAEKIKKDIILEISIRKAKDLVINNLAEIKT